ncbi:MAG: glycosyltransferase [Candidatus Rokubacteria bacterium]|nr:glycosyltransferase [Candidatus Rokubacteria bacterium]
MHALVVTLGTAGDVLPMIGLGRALAARGHRVTVALNERFAGEARAAGLDFQSIGSVDEWREVFENPTWYDPKRGYTVFTRGAILPAYQRVLAAIEAVRAPEDLVLVAAIQAFGALGANRRLGIPLAVAYLQPATLRWVLPYQELRAAGAASGLAIHLRTALRFIGYRFLGDEAALLTDDRALHLGLFPEWFAVPAATWPPTVRFSGFPLYDGGDSAELPDEARRFMSEGEPPVLITPGSNVHWAGPFCRAALAACARLGRRAVVLTRYADQLPPLDPETARHFPFLPLGPALACAAVMIHHAGISTVGRCLAAGVPQLVSPISYDHPFNGMTLEALGTGIAVPRERFTEDAATAALDRLLHDPGSRRQASRYAAEMAAHNRLDAACEAIEALHRGRGRDR